MTELAELAVMERTTLTRNLRLLEENGWINSEAGEDRRKRMISLTRAGAEQLKQALPVWRKVQARMSDSLGGTRKQRLLKDLRFAAELSV